MANRTTAPAFELTEEQIDFSNRLRRILLVSPQRRPALIAQLAQEHGVSERTIRRKMQRNEIDPHAVFQRQGRSDSGAFRVPHKTLVLILEHFWQNPADSAAQALAYLLEHQREAMTYTPTGGSGKEKQVSIGTVRRVQKIFLHGWLKEVEGRNDANTLS